MMKIKQEPAGQSLKRIVEEMSGTNLNACYQCKKCSSGCPVATLVQSPPSEIIKRLHMGAGDELLDSDLIWTCLSCETCYGRCPMEINFPALIDALRRLSMERRSTIPAGNMPLFNRSFLENVKRFGRSYDLGMIAGYKLGTGSLFNDATKFPTMLVKGKMAILPPSGADKKSVKRVFDKVVRREGKNK